MNYALSLTANELTSKGVSLISGERDNWNAAQTMRNLNPEQQAKQNALIRAEVKILRAAYLVQTKNLEKDDILAVEMLWKETFASTNPLILHEAVKRFILSDSKGFFPAPGLIVAHIEKIAAEIREKEREHLERIYLEGRLANEA